eukprot:3610261-Pleurochrysis_carterae.AAC.2
MQRFQRGVGGAKNGPNAQMQRCAHAAACAEHLSSTDSARSQPTRRGLHSCVPDGKLPNCGEFKQNDSFQIYGWFGRQSAETPNQIKGFVIRISGVIAAAAHIASADAAAVGAALDSTTISDTVNLNDTTTTATEATTDAFAIASTTASTASTLSMTVSTVPTPAPISGLAASGKSHCEPTRQQVRDQRFDRDALPGHACLLRRAVKRAAVNDQQRTGNSAVRGRQG